MRDGRPHREITLDLPRHTSALIILLLPLGAVAQEEAPGVDLSTPPASERKKEQAPLPPPPAGTQRRPSDQAQPNDRAQPIAQGESDVALDDRVKAVQRKGFLKRHRFELGLSVPATVNDAFFEKVGFGAKLAYNLEDSFGLALRGAYYAQLRTSHVREGKLAFSSQLLASQIYGQAMLDGVWSPVYGKVAWLGSQIVHFDLYLLAGFGGVWSATSIAPRKEGPHLATDFGGGVRFYPTDWLAFDGGIVATLYPDQPITSVPSTVQKVVAAQIGITFFFPFTFEYVYP
jgi:outer membrane beta-barrel protein